MSAFSDSGRTNGTATQDWAPHAKAVAAASPDGVEHLSTVQCWQLMQACELGRLAVTGLDGVPDIFPVNYTVHDGSLFIKSAPGSKLIDITAHPVAAFEIDGADSGFSWSVVIRGDVQRMAIDKEIRESGVQALNSLSPTPKYNYLRVTPSSISGRRFMNRTHDAQAAPHPSIVKIPTGVHEPARPVDDTVTRANIGSSASQPPYTIPHFAPLHL